MVRVNSLSRASAENLLGTTRTCHLPAPLGTRRTSGGVLSSLPGQKGQLGTKEATGFPACERTSSFGRLARSVAMMTHSLVTKFCRSSGIKTPQKLSIGTSSKILQYQNRDFECISAVVKFRTTMPSKIPVGI